MSIQKNHNILDLENNLNEVTLLIENYGLFESLPHLIYLFEISNNPEELQDILQPYNEQIINNTKSLPYIKFLIRNGFENKSLLSNKNSTLTSNPYLLLLHLKYNKRIKEHDKILKKPSNSYELKLYKIFHYKEKNKATKLLDKSKNSPEFFIKQSKDPLIKSFELLNNSEHLFKINDNQGAIATALSAIEIIPYSLHHWYALARYLAAQNEEQAAIEALLEALTYNKYDFECLSLLLNICVKHDKIFLAERYISKTPTHISDNLSLRGDVLVHKEDYKSAAGFYLLALDANRHNTYSIKGLVGTYFTLKEYDKCLLSFKKLIKSDHLYLNNLTLLSFALESAMYCLDWQFISLIEEHLYTLLQSTDKIKGLNLVFAILAIKDSPSMHYLVASKAANIFFDKKNPINLSLKNINTINKKDSIIHLGYISADIRNHIVFWLLSEFIEKIDPEKFKIYIFSYAKNTSQSIIDFFKTKNIIFFDISTISDSNAAAMIKNHSIDILIDLTVFTSTTRSNILSFRPSPIQISQMGFPSTSGAKDIYDYKNTDVFKVSKDSEFISSENLIKLPEISGIVSYKQKPTTETSRHQNNLPENHFIYACFNQSYKITRPVFYVWCRILREVRNSTLWLYVSNDKAKENLLKTATEFGVEEDRFIFAPYMPMDEHLKRLSCADLILDTMPYGNHSTGAFALLCEVPLLAYRGKSYVASVSASFLEVIECTEMIVDNEDDYVNLAIRFANDSEFRQSVRDKVQRAANDPCPLFDVDRFVAHYQKGLEIVWENYLAGNEPRDIEVPLLFEPYKNNF